MCRTEVEWELGIVILMWSLLLLWRCVRPLSWRLEGDLGGDGRLAAGRFIMDHE